MLIKILYLAGSLAFVAGSVMSMAGIGKPSTAVYLAGSLLFATGSVVALVK